MALPTDQEPEWTVFFEECGIPTEAATIYAKEFTENCLTKNELPDLNMDLLKSMGITAIGHALAILRHAKLKSTAEVVNTPTIKSEYPVFKPPSVAAKLPEIPPEMTHPQFRKFRVDWDVYKQITGLPTNYIANHLYSACCSEVQTSLINTKSNCLSLPENELLDTIQLIVTKQTNPAVHRMNFRRIVQQENETIKEFTVRLRSAAIDCEFSCPSCEADISSPSIKDQFISGLNNDILQTDILAKADKLLKLEEIIRHSEAFEGALRDQPKLLNTPSTVARISDHRRSKLPPPSRKPAHMQCSGCGSKDHGIFGTKSRITSCPAWGKFVIIVRHRIILRMSVEAHPIQPRIAFFLSHTSSTMPIATHSAHSVRETFKKFQQN